MNHSEHEYLTFFLENEEYGIDILCVQEIRVLQQLTELPKKPDYIRGVINLRGTIIPIVDLRMRFGKQAITDNDKTVVIILKSKMPSAEGSLGIIVDAVSEVYNFEPESINVAPKFGKQIDHCFIHGLANSNEKLIVLLDSKQLLDVDSLYQQDSHHHHDMEREMV